MTDRLFYQITDGPLSVRATPGTGGARLGELSNGIVLEVDATSRTVVDGFIWWKHSGGWSAEGSADGKTVFMRQNISATTPPAPSSTEPRFYQVTNGPVSIRVNPDVTSTKVGELPNGTVIEVLADGRAVGGGFAWVRHERGWSALGKSDNTATFMQPAQPPAPPAPTSPTTPVTPVTPTPVTPTPPTPEPEAAPIRYFRVTDGPVTIRKAADPASEKVGEIANGVVIEVNPDSRTTNAGFVYWQHDKGWSAERRIGGAAPFMTPSAEPPPPAPPAPVIPTAPDGTPIRFFEVIEGPVSVRAEPTLTAERKGQLNVGEQIEVIPSSRTESQGYVWWQHSKGWSPERKIGSLTAYLSVIPKLTLKMVDGVPYLPVIVQHPVALTDVQWIQYYGNTIFAHKLRVEGKFWYNYCQSLHGGFDYGTSKPVPIVAGVEGLVIDVNLNKSTYAPNYTRVKVGPYIFIYGHIARPSLFNVGDKIGPDTVVGFIDAGGQNHLHLEIRYGLKLLNPLELMTEERQNEITSRFKDFSKHFYASPSWSQWQTPFDQPVLNLQNFGSEIIIGPHAR